ncbi:MAG TPA: NAD(P)H-dependent glycerol-3-phosphate dehydrogenase [Gammaproteobacteria bacterium]|nr:NAD(P)H-dependent glycerol-3-phosphate dehydrogenase [Gammaproteobacteria bacterium]
MSFLVLGAGSWGSATALHLARLKHGVTVWGRDAAQIAHMQKSRENKKYLPGVKLPQNISFICDDLDKHIPQSENIILAVPSHVFREMLEKIKPYFSHQQTLIWITKGLDPETHELLHQVVQEILGNTVKLAVLSGPSFAKEVAADLPTAVTLASNDKHVAEKLVKLFHSPHFRVYASSDIKGVEIGGAVKNVLAIAVGIAQGLGCGANAQAALITRGIAEMMRLGSAMGGLPETFMGLSGVGDLILTCTNDQSRNRRFGTAIGKGLSREKALKSIGQVVEGIQTANEIHNLAKKYKIDMPITEQVYRVLYQDISPDVALEHLLAREPKDERR